MLRSDAVSQTRHSEHPNPLIFLRAFEEKVASTRAKTDAFPPDSVQSTAEVQLFSFRACITDNIRRVVMRSLTKSRSLDPIQTFMLKESIDMLLPYLTAMCNASLLKGEELAKSQKHAVVTPLGTQETVARPSRSQEIYRPQFPFCYLFRSSKKN